MSADWISRRGFLAVGLVGLLGTRAAAAGKPTVTEERMEVTLTKDQQIYLNGRPLALTSLEQTLRDTFKNRTDKTLYLKADQALQYGFVVETMDRIRKSGIEKLGMVTEPVRGS